MQDKLFILPAREPTEPEPRSKHNLPAQLTPLIGREHEVAEACTLLRRPDVRLVTLTGTGGVGKTRLALQVASDVQDAFAGGVSFVSLAPISDPELVIPTIAQTLEIKESGARPLLDLLKAFLKDKHLLLVLDNFEQILPAAPHLTDLLAFCPELKLVVTSRATLHVQGEHEFSVPPLALPDLKQLPPIDALSHSAAVASFFSVPRRSNRHSRSPRSMLAPSPRSVSGSMGCPWRLNWPLPASSCSHRKPCCPGWNIGCRC